MPQINHIAVVVVIVATQLVGFLWYSLGFGKLWAPGYRLAENALKSTPPVAYVGTLAVSILFTYALAILIGLLEVAGAAAGLAVGAAAWAGLIAPRYLLHAMYGRIAVPATLIDLGFDLLVSLLAGGILGVWRP